MRYIINGVLTYNSEDGSIRTEHMAEYDLITLTPVLNRLLAYLLKNQGLILTKESFFNEVWDSHGKSGSANTLKQYISYLRKILDSHLRMACIVTIPGQGYMLTSDLIVETLNENSESVLTVLGCTHESITSISSKKIIREMLFLNEKMITVAIIFLLIIITFLSIRVITLYTGEKNSLQLVRLIDIGSCPVYGEMKQKMNSEEKRMLSAEVNFLKNTFNIECHKGAIFYFFSSPYHERDYVERYSMLSSCYDKGNCITYRVNNYENTKQ